MAWVSFEEIRKAVSLEMVIQHYGFELRRVNATALRGKCPLPMHGSDKSRASFTATLNKGTGGVWACQSKSCVAARGGTKGGNALDLVATMEGCELRDAALKIQSWFNIPETGHEQHAEATEKTEPSQLVSKENTENGDEPNKPLTFTLQGIEPVHPYLLTRGVPEEIARKFGIGYFSGRGSMQGRIVFEIHNEKGELVAYAGRALENSEERYKFPSGFHKSRELYNLHRVISQTTGRRRVVIVEGFFGCLSVVRAGFPCVALMGNSMSEAQEELIVRHFTVACILLDGNAVGRKGSEDCLTRLGRRMFVYAPLLPEDKQPDMLSAEELQALIKK